MMRTARKQMKRVFALVLAIALLLPALPAGAASSKELKSRLAGLETRQSEVRDRIRSLENQENAALKQKELIDEEIEVLQEEIDVLEEAIGALTDQIDETKGEIDRLTSEIDALSTRIAVKEREHRDLYNLFKTRIRVMHEEDLTSYAGIIFGADSVADLMSRIEAVANILTADRNTMKKLEEMKAEIEEDKSALDGNRTALEQKEAELEEVKAEKEEDKRIQDDKMDELVERQADARKIVNSIRGSIAASQGVLDELESQSRSLEDEIRAAVKAEAEAAEAKAREEAARKAKEEEEAKSSEKQAESGTEKTSEKPAETETEKTAEKEPEPESEKTSEKASEKSSEKSTEKESSSGKSSRSLSWPLPGRSRISSGFGYRTHPVTGKKSSFHSGIDIPAPAGTPIRCAAAGKVIKAGYNVAYGNMIVVDHGNGISTMYAHMRSRALYKVGSTVSKGTVLGYVGTTGWSTGNHLHFSVLKNGDYVSPLKYVSP